MSLQVVIAACAKDIDRAVDLLEWCSQLGKTNHPCLLVCDPDVSWTDGVKALDTARKAFGDVECITLENHVEGWIPGSTALFKAAAVYCAGRPFFWVEPDAVPMRAGWVDEIEKAYAECQRPFMGVFVSHNNPAFPQPYMEGCGVYPADCWQRFEPIFNPQQSWTKWGSQVSVPNGFNTPLIHHLWGQADNPPTFADRNVPGTNVFCLAQIPKQACLYHRCKDGSLIHLLRRKHGFANAATVYGHGGDIGDVIYALCAIKAAGGGKLVLTRHKVREMFNAEKANKLIPLLKLQPYLSSVEYYEGKVTEHGSSEKPSFVDVNLNLFRPLQFKLRNSKPPVWENIPASHLRLLGLDTNLGNGDPWLRVDREVQIPGKPVVFSRTRRYRNPRFGWSEIMKKYGQRAVFVGFPDEHSEFCRTFGVVQYHPTEDLLELARVIAGCKLFVGNQSAPYAIAEGLKKTAILESCPWIPDCKFNRPNLVYGTNGFFRFPVVV